MPFISLNDAAEKTADPTGTVECLDRRPVKYHRRSFPDI
jgi:hypothetical protein